MVDLFSSKNGIAVVYFFGIILIPDLVSRCRYLFQVGKKFVKKNQCFFYDLFSGIMNMIGTILFTSISDISWVEPFWVFATSLLLCGVTTFLAPFCYNFATFIALSLSFGLFASSLALTPIGKV